MYLLYVFSPLENLIFLKQIENTWKKIIVIFSANKCRKSERNRILEFAEQTKHVPIFKVPTS